MIHIDTIEAWDFMVFEHVQLDLRDAGLVFLIGHLTNSIAYSNNQVGKSCLLTMFPWCVWEETTKDIADVKAVIRRGASYCKVRVTGRLDDHPFFIERTRSKRNVDVTTDLVPSDRQWDAQKEINRYLGSFRGAKNIVLLTQGRALEFVTGAPAVRQQIIEDLYSLDRYRLAHQKASADLKKWRGDLDQFLSTVANLKERYERRLEQVAAEQRIAQERQNTSRQILERNLHQLDLNIAAVQLAHMETQTELDHYTAELAKYPPLIEVQLTYNTLFHQVHQNTADVATTKQDLERWRNATRCEACHTPLHSEPPIWQELNDRLTSLNLKGADLAKRFANALAPRDEVQLLTDQCARTRERLRQHAISVAPLLADRAAIERELSLLDAPVPAVNYDEFVAVELEITEYQNRIEQLTNFLPYLEAVVKALHRDGIPAEYITQTLPVLNQIQTEIMAEMTAGELNALIANKNLDMAVWQNNQPIPYAETSEGQRRRIVISLFLAVAESLLKQTGHSWDCRFIDELFDVLDQTGIDRVMSVLRSLVEAGVVTTIVVASQRTDLHTMECFNQVWVIESDGQNRKLLVEKR